MTYSIPEITVGVSDIHGIGCVAKHDLTEHQCIGAFTGQWMICPMGQLEPIYPPGIDGSDCVDVAIFNDAGGRGQCIVLHPIANGKYTPLDRINHSTTPNCEVHGLAVFTRGRIEQGQELTIDYRQLDCTPLVSETMRRKNGVRRA